MSVFFPMSGIQTVSASSSHHTKGYVTQTQGKSEGEYESVSMRV